MTRRVVITGLGTRQRLRPRRRRPPGRPSWRAAAAWAASPASIPKCLDMPCQIAAELKDFDPLEYFAEARAQEARPDDPVRPRRGRIEAWDGRRASSDAHGFDPERAGAIIGTGIGGLDSIEQTHTTIMEKGPQRVSPYFVPAHDGQRHRGQHEHPVQPAGARTSSRRRPAPRATTPWRSPIRSIRGGESDMMLHGRRRGDHHVDGHGGLQLDARHVHAQRRAREGEPAVRQGPRRLRHGRGRRHPASSRSSSTPSSAARTIYAEVLGAGHDGRRAPHHGARPGRARARRGPWRWR